jgi:3-oxoadipate enol-lactonase
MRAHVNGLSLAYTLEGDAKGPVVMMSHGLALDQSLWSYQVPALTERFSVLRYDLRGHGGSEKSVTTLAIEAQADDAVGLLKALGRPRVHFVGLSLGGMIGQALAIRHPEFLASLTLVDTASEVPPENKPVWEQRIQAALSHGMDELVEPTVERWFTPAFRASHPNVVDWARVLVRSARLDCYVAGARAIAEFNVTKQLGRIVTPTLIVVGESDMTTPVHSAKLMHQLIKGSEIHVLSPAAHLSNVEQASAFNGVLLRALEAQQTRASRMTE